MKRFVEGGDRRQATLLPDCVDDYVTEENPVRAVEAFVDALDLAALGFAGFVSARAKSVDDRWRPSSTYAASRMASAPVARRR